MATLDPKLEPFALCKECFPFVSGPNRLPKVRISAWELSRVMLCEGCSFRRKLYLRQQTLLVEQDGGQG